MAARLTRAALKSAGTTKPGGVGNGEALRRLGDVGVILEGMRELSSRDPKGIV